MSALNSLLGTPGEPLMCTVVGEASVHWWPSGAVAGDLCLCGVLPLRQPKPQPLDPCCDQYECSCRTPEEDDG